MFCFELLGDGPHLHNPQTCSYACELLSSYFPNGGYSAWLAGRWLWYHLDSYDRCHRQLDGEQYAVRRYPVLDAANYLSTILIYSSVLCYQAFDSLSFCQFIPLGFRIAIPTSEQWSRCVFSGSHVAISLKAIQCVSCPPQLNRKDYLTFSTISCNT